jgi:amino acid transporter
MAFFVAFCAWVPGPLLLLATSDLLVTYLQGLNAGWLLAPWQQGIALMVIIFLAGIVALQRHRTVQNVINVTAGVIIFTALLIGLAGIVWLAKGNPSATPFSPASNWTINWSPWWNPFSGAGNFGLFGVITLGYLGVNIPLNMAGELRRASQGRQDEQRVSRMIKQHLLWGVLIVIVGYLLVTFAVLVVEGQNASYVLFAMVTTVTTVMGKGMGMVVAIGIMLTIFVATVVYTNTFARWLLVGGIDKRLPTSVGRLNRNRVPANAIIFQTFAAILLVFLFFIVLPLIVGGSNSVNLVQQVYFVGVGAATMLWAFATIFLFINVLKLYRINPDEFRRHSISPVPVIMVCAGLGLISGLFAMVDTLFNSYIPPLIPNAQWWWLVGGVTLIVVIIATLASMVASSEAAWQDLNG